MTPRRFRFTVLVLSALGTALGLQAQAPKLEFPAASPACTLNQRVGLTDIEIVYSRPSAKGREIFGGIVPFGQVWRTGANASTKISFSTPVRFGGKAVPAGKYALYTIPGAQQWTVILSKNTGLWGAFGYDPKDDVARFDVDPVSLAEDIETFTIEFNHLRDESAVLNLVWEHTVVPVTVEVDVARTLVPQIEAAMAAPGKKQAGLCYQAASFYFDHGMDLTKALEWVNTGIGEHPPFEYELLHLKAQILAKQGDKAGAIAAAKQSSELAQKAEGPGSSFIRMNQDLISKLQ